MTKPTCLALVFVAGPAFLVGACDDPVANADPPPATVRSTTSTVTAVQGPPRYSIRVLDVAAHLDPDVRIGTAGRLNNRGELVAQAFRFGAPGEVSQAALIWDTDAGTVRTVEIDGMVDLPSINDAGQLAGALRPPGASGPEPYLWSPGTGVQRLGFRGQAAALAGDGAVAGRRFTEDHPGGEAFRWDPVTGLSPLGVLPGEAFSTATGTNAAGFVVGFSGGRAVAWDPVAGMLPLPGDAVTQRAFAINEAGRIVGVRFELGLTTGVVWDAPDAPPVLLPCDPPFQECRAIDINERGEILGSYGNDEAEIPMLWVDGQPHDLAGLVDAGDAPPFLFALAINDRGQIGGVSMDLGPDGQLLTAPVLLTPTTEARVVRIDIKPHSDPNSFNLDGQGVLPVAVLGEADLDPAEIDAASLTLNGLVVARRGSGEPKCGTEDVDGDRRADLVCAFEDNLARWTGPDDVGTLEGALHDGTAIRGSDAIRLTR